MSTQMRKISHIRVKTSSENILHAFHLKDNYIFSLRVFNFYHEKKGKSENVLKLILLTAVVTCDYVGKLFQMS